MTRPASPREVAMRRHPAYQSRVAHTDDRMQHLIDAAHDQQAMDAANRELALAEQDAGGPMRAVDEWHHKASTSEDPHWINLVGPLALAVVIIVICTVFGLLYNPDGGWPA